MPVIVTSRSISRLSLLPGLIVYKRTHSILFQRTVLHIAPTIESFISIPRQQNASHEMVRPIVTKAFCDMTSKTVP